MAFSMRLTCPCTIYFQCELVLCSAVLSSKIKHPKRHNSPVDTNDCYLSFGGLSNMFFLNERRHTFTDSFRRSRVYTLIVFVLEFKLWFRPAFFLAVCLQVVCRQSYFLNFLMSEPSLLFKLK